MHRFSTLLFFSLLFSFVSFGKTPDKPFDYAGIPVTDGKYIEVNIVEKAVIVKRYNADGSLDLTFGTNGVLSEYLGGRDVQYSFTYIQPDGKIDIIGYMWAVYADWFVLRLNTDGTKDAFSYSGFGTQNVFPGRATMDCGGRLIIVGQENATRHSDFGMTVYTPDLSGKSIYWLDFSTYIPIGQDPPSEDYPNAVYSLYDNQLLVTGTADGVYAEALYQLDETTQTYKFIRKSIGTPTSFTLYIAAPADVVISTDQNSCTASNVSLGSPSVLVPCYQSLTNDAPAVFQPGTTTVTWTLTDINGLTNTAIQKVTVNDSIPPQLEAPSVTSFCTDPSGTYSIAKPSYSDNCSLAGISYQITGATVRNGTGDDASGVFNPGESTITWLVVDRSGNTTAGVTMVNIGSGSLDGNITTSKVLQNAQDNTVYLGYEPGASITLTASLQGYSEATSYQWSNGATTPSITVSPSVTTTYTVTVTNNTGCSIQLSKTIQVVDVRCGNKMDKVALCRNGNQICVSANAVSAQLRSGATLGDCTNTKHNGKENLKQSKAKDGLTVNVLSNPSPSYFIMNINSTSSTPILLSIISSEGKLLEKRIFANNQSVTVGHDYRPGVYYATVEQGSERVILKLVKLKE
jgi:Domain of unknown function (DUF5122) beta-propeller